MFSEVLKPRQNLWVVQILTPGWIFLKRRRIRCHGTKATKSSITDLPVDGLNRGYCSNTDTLDSSLIICIEMSTTTIYLKKLFLASYCLLNYTKISIDHCYKTLL